MPQTKLVGNRRKAMFTFAVTVLVVALLSLPYNVVRVRSMRRLPDVRPKNWLPWTIFVSLWTVGVGALYVLAFKNLEIEEIKLFWLPLGMAELIGPLVFFSPSPYRLPDVEAERARLGWLISGNRITFVEGGTLPYQAINFGFAHFYGGLRVRHIKRLVGPDGRSLSATLVFRATENLSPEDFRPAVDRTFELFVERAQGLLNQRSSEEQLRELAPFSPIDSGLRLEVQKFRLYLPPIKLVPEPEGS